VVPIKRLRESRTLILDVSTAVTFTGLGVSPGLVAVLDKAGIGSPFPIQTLTIPDALAGRDICGKAQTGSGKTLAYGLPLVERTSSAAPRRPHAIVLVPTRELANQVAEALAPFAAARGLWLAPIYGGVSMVRQIGWLRQGLDIVIATPGRLNDLLERRELSLADVEFVVVDEADQMADMGFLPQVERILQQVEGQPQTLLFSATLDGAIGSLVRKYQHDPVHYAVESEASTVDTLAHRFIGVYADQKIGVTARVCAGARRALVFVRTTHGADRVAKQLEDQGLRAAPIHGRLNQGKRERTLAAFADGTAPVLVATNVAARGLHIDDLDVVVHFDMPDDHKNYVHRSGRTARAGEDGMVVTLVLPEQERDVAQLQREAGLDLAVVPMAPDDARLLNLAAWEAPAGMQVQRGSHLSAPRVVGRRPGNGPRRAQDGGRSRPSSGGARRPTFRPASAGNW
jgi:superfamily II DNA/RNA helicase